MSSLDPAALFDLTGKTAVVTGASSGLGRRAADVMLAAGARVVGIARRADVLVDWANESDGKASFVEADLSIRGELTDIAKRSADIFGPPDILVNAAGINTRQTADDVTPEGWDVTLDLNLAAPFFLAQSFVPSMKENSFGRIINFASLQSFRAFPGGVSYGASKGGVTQLTRAMAEAWFSMIQNVPPAMQSRPVLVATASLLILMARFCFLRPTLLDMSLVKP